jgi:hypothetical protein
VDPALARRTKAEPKRQWLRIFAVAGRIGRLHASLPADQQNYPCDQERLRLMRGQLTLCRRCESMVTMSTWWQQRPEASQDGASQECLDI